MSKLVKCVVPISGGKDSQACLQLAVSHFGKEYVIGLFCDTQFEHPLTYAHVERMASLYDVEIVRRCEGDVLSLCERTGRFPSGIARFCTNELKINVSKKFYKQLAKQQGQGFEVWYGMRTDESQTLYAGIVEEFVGSCVRVLIERVPDSKPYLRNVTDSTYVDPHVHLLMK